MRWVAAQGLGTLGAYVALPFGVLPFFAMWPALITTLGVPRGAGLLKAVVFAMCFIPGYVTLVWLVYVQPRGDHLVVCENGFRLKITFKRREVLFRDLLAISFGLDSAIFKGITQVLGVLQPRQAQMLGNLSNAAMQLHFKNGSRTTFKSFLHRFELEDLQRFFDYLAGNYPQFFRELTA